MEGAQEAVRKGQNHLGLVAALADDQSGYIDEHLPIIMATLETVAEAMETFGQKL